MSKDHFETGAPAALYELTYSPAHDPNGKQVDQAASRQVLQERRTATVAAPHADAAVWRFERDHGRMVTACRRVLDERADGDELHARGPAQ